MKRGYLTKTVLALSWVSLLSDVASEMLYPILPVYLKTIGFTALSIGVLEGVAEFVVGLSKAWFGNYSDKTGKRVPLIRLGYFLSALSKAMMALFTWPAWIFFSRSTDRLGKGIRTGARDAILVDESEKLNRGKVFGFHRGMDTLGAAIGPCCALIYLAFFPGNYKTLFLIAFAPGMASVLLTFLLKEKNATAKKASSKKAFGFLSYWKSADSNYRKVTIGLFAFALFNSSDAFLLLIAKQNGLSDTRIIGGYIFYNVIYALTSFQAGVFADKLGPKKMFLTGIFFFVAAYASMPFAGNFYAFLAAFLLYGLFSASTEGISKAWISLYCNEDDRATAMGFFSGVVSIVALVSSVLAGFLWMNFSPVIMFLFSASGAAAVAVYLGILKLKVDAD